MMTAAPRVSPEETLTWQLVDAAPGALFYTAPALGAPTPSRHREQEWTPKDSPDEPAGSHPAEPEHQSALDYASHIGRVGLLAAALGLGAAFARSPGIAWAEPAETDTASSSESESEPSTSEPAETPASSTPSASSRQPGTTTSEQRSTSRSQTSTDISGSQTSVSVTAPGSSGPRAVVRSSGGAHTTTPRTGPTADTAHEAPRSQPAPPAGQQPETTPAPSPAPAAPVSTPEQTAALPAAPVTTPDQPQTPAQSAAPTPPTRPHRHDITAPPTPGHPGTQATAPAPRHRPTGPDQTAPPTGAAAQTPAVQSAQAGAASMSISAPASPSITTADSETVTSQASPTPPRANVVNSLLGTLGMGPLGATASPAPVADPPTSWAVLDWARRQKHQGANETTTTTARPAPTRLMEDSREPTSGAPAGVPTDDVLTYHIAGGPAHGTIAIAPDGSYTYTPTTGRDPATTSAGQQNSFSVTVSDTNGASTTMPVTATTTPPATRLTLTGTDDTSGVVHVSITPTDTTADQPGHLIVHNPSYTTTAPASTRTATAATPRVDKTLFATRAAPVTTAAVIPAPTAAIATAPTTVIGWVTGERAPNYTSSRFGIAGADLGIMWDNGIKDNPTTAVDEHQVLMAFGDTFSGAGQTGIWRMNTLLRSSDHVLSNGMTVADGSTTDPFSGAPLASANFSKQIIASPGFAVGSEVTIIPTAGISVPYNNAYGARQYVNFMSVRSWDSAGRWTTNYSGIAYSDDNGQTWTVARSSIRPAATGRSTLPYVSGNQNFQQGAYVKGVTLDATGKPVYDANGQLVTDGYVYSYGTPSGRGGTVYLSRVKQADILDQTKYEYWNGSTWVLNKPSAAVPVLPGTTTGFWFFRQTTYPSVSEMSVQYNTYLNKYVLMYCDNNNNVVIRTATKPQGPWSAPTTLVTSTQYPGLYAPMMNPWSGTAQVKGPDGVTPEDPRYLYWNLSMWGDYNVQSMRTDLSALKT